MNINADEVVTIKEAALLVPYSGQSICGWTRAGLVDGNGNRHIMPSKKLGGTLIVNRGDVLKFAELAIEKKPFTREARKNRLQAGKDQRKGQLDRIEQRLEAIESILANTHKRD